MTGWKRPSLETKFHIDYDWWQSSGKDLRVAVRGQLCRDDQARFPDHRNLESVDWVDPETAEVVRADALLQTLRSHCARQPEFISLGQHGDLEHLPHLPAERQPAADPARTGPADAVDQRRNHPAHPGQRPGLHGHPARHRAGLNDTADAILPSRSHAKPGDPPAGGRVSSRRRPRSLCKPHRRNPGHRQRGAGGQRARQQLALALPAGCRRAARQVRRITVLARRPGEIEDGLRGALTPASRPDPDVRRAGTDAGRPDRRGHRAGARAARERRSGRLRDDPGRSTRDLRERGTWRPDEMLPARAKMAQLPRGAEPLPNGWARRRACCSRTKMSTIVVAARRAGRDEGHLLQQPRPTAAGSLRRTALCGTRRQDERVGRIDPRACRRRGRRPPSPCLRQVARPGLRRWQRRFRHARGRGGVRTTPRWPPCWMRPRPTSGQRWRRSASRQNDAARRPARAYTSSRSGVELMRAIATAGSSGSSPKRR